MRRILVRGGTLLIVCSVLAACGGGSGTPAGSSSNSGNSNPPTGAAPPELQVQEDVPILEGALDLKVTSNGTYITYAALGTVDDATQFYQEQLAALGWEQKNRQDSGFGDSITLLRSKPDQNISVTIQSVSGGENIKVLIALSPK